MNSALAISFVAISILGLLLSPSIISTSADSHAMMSPRQQMANGVAAEDVKCKEGLVLMIRATNGAAACVKAETSMKLSDVNWGSVIAVDESMMEEEEHMEEQMMEEEMMENGMEEMTEEESHEKEIELEEGMSMGEEDSSPIETPEESIEETITSDVSQMPLRM